MSITKNSNTTSLRFPFLSDIKSKNQQKKDLEIMLNNIILILKAQ